MLLERPGRRGGAVLPQLVLVGLNLGVAEAVAPQLQHGPLQLAAALARKQLGRQLPVGRFGQRGGDLLAGLLLLVVFELPLQVLLDRVAQLAFATRNRPARSATRASAPAVRAS